MIRKIIQIDEEKCTGCGLCANACHEGAIGIIEGKAKLLRDDFCDGLGDCLPACPEGAISFVEREALKYDEKAVWESKMKKISHFAASHPGCPGSQTHVFSPKPECSDSSNAPEVKSRLRQWPVQIKLAPTNAPFFDGASLLIAADCTAYAYGDFHNSFIKDRITLIGCPKLDEGDYSEKLSQIIKNNDIKDITVVRMEVPCCSGIHNATVRALETSGKALPVNTVIISLNGSIINP